MRMWQTHGFFGGHVFLDFVNTIEDPGKTRQESALADWQEVAEWAAAAGLADADARTALAALDRAPDAAERLAALIDFRETAWAVAHALAEGRGPDPADLDRLAARSRKAHGHARLERADGRFAWRATPGDAPDRWLCDALALALDDLLTRQDLARLRECGRCTGLFLDHGRGAGRRWCRMRTCGNRAKVTAHRARSAPAERGG